MKVTLVTDLGELPQIVSVNGVNCSNQRYISKDGWTVMVNYDGSVTCTSKETVEGKYYETTLKVFEDGFVRVSKLSRGARRELSRFRLKDWKKSTFVINLDRRERRREKSFHKKQIRKNAKGEKSVMELKELLEKLGLHSVSWEPPNGVYFVRHEKLGTGTPWRETETVQTDGEITNKGKKRIGKGKGKWTSTQVVEISKATWVIVTIFSENGEECKILYTISDLTTLDLPKL